MNQSYFLQIKFSKKLTVVEFQNDKASSGTWASVITKMGHIFES